MKRRKALTVFCKVIIKAWLNAKVILKRKDAIQRHKYSEHIKLILKVSYCVYYNLLVICQ